MTTDKFQCKKFDPKGVYTKFEYLIIDQKDGVNPDDYRELNYLGENGWELVSICDHRWYFKRCLGEVRKLSKCPPKKST